jgi:hypothetical protein
MSIYKYDKYHVMDCNATAHMLVVDVLSTVYEFSLIKFIKLARAS